LYRTLLASLTVATLVVASARAESGLASYYPGIGRADEMTCAHRTRPMGSMVTVRYQGRVVRCRVNDRGPFIKGRVIDVSTSAARALGMIDAGVVLVSLHDEEMPSEIIRLVAPP
jgi:rare lipoprotein A